MDRATRKANLKNLQLPNTSTSNAQQRKTRQTIKTSTTEDTAISNYFLTPNKQNKQANVPNHCAHNKLSSNRSVADIPNEEETDLKKSLSVIRGKRTKLDTFIFKNNNNIPDVIKKNKKSLNDDDFMVPEKKVKKAPKLSATNSQAKISRGRPKKQTTIKSAFLRNEQIFAEIAAQHCAADQFDGDDVQLALAISQSEAESKGIIEVANENKVNQGVNLLDDKNDGQLIREQLKKYGFRTAERSDYNNFAAAFIPKGSGRRLKCKWANKFTALTLRSPEKQLKKLQENIEKLLNSQFRTKPLNEQDSLLPPYKLKSSLLKNSDIDDKIILQSIDKANQVNEFYFVTELFEVNKLPAGHLLKDWNAIQGRDLTPNAKSKQTSEKLQNIYKELDEYFKSKKCLNWSSDNEAKNIQPENTLINNHEINEAEENNEIDKFVELIEHEQSREALKEQVNRELTKELQLINDEIEVKNVETKPCSTLLCDNNVLKLLPSPKSLDIMQVSSCSINTQATINSTQTNNRSNSPDLFADSDVELEDAENEQRGVETVKNFSVNKNRNSSINDIQEVAGVTTYEIFSSDEVKNTSLLEQNNTDGQANMNSDPASDVEIIDLTQDDLRPSKHNPTNDNLSESKPIIEMDLFAESPWQEETEDHESVDINSNSPISKYQQENNEETLKFTLSMETEKTDEYCKEIRSDNLIKLSQSLQTPKNIKEQDIINEKEDSFKLSLSLLTPEKTKTEITNNENEESFKLSITLETREAKKIKEQDDSFILSLSSETLEEQKLNEKEESFKVSLNTNINLHEEEDDDDIVLREIAMNQTNNSFLNFQGTKQLETCFHTQTSAREKEIATESFQTCADDTIFRELCNKYLTKTNDTSHTSKNNKQKFDSNKSFSQLLPKIKTPQKYETFTQFSTDFDATFENNLTLKRKSMSFTAKTPLKIETNQDNNNKLTKSHSFNNTKVEKTIDLTQNESENEYLGDNEEDYDCLILSDDEINYSIWQADKTDNFKTCELSQHEDDLISLSDNEAESDEELKRLSKDCLSKDYLNLKNKTKSAAEESYSDFEISSPPTPDELKFDRSEFGILEEYSEPADSTPTKVLNEASFLNSPTEATAPMKHYSICHKFSQKFQNLINNAEYKSPDYCSTHDLNDFDEFDRIVYTSPSKTAKTPCQKPQGIDQLLNGEITFKVTQNTFNTESSISPKTTPLKPLTSTKQIIKCNNRTYTIRSCTSPKPDYATYTESELLKELYNFGIKPLKRKQAVKMLEYIYNQTHPILMEDEEIEKEKNDVMLMEDFDRPCTSKAALSGKTTYTKGVEKLYSNESVGEKGDMLLEEFNKKLNLQDSCGWDMLRYSSDLKAELLDEQYILQTNVTKKTPQPLLPFHIAWYNLVCSNRKLHESILMYEPIDLQEIFLFLKGLGYRYEPKDLKIFFDRRCIIFRYDLTSSNPNSVKANDVNRHVRKSKKVNKKSNY